MRALACLVLLSGAASAQVPAWVRADATALTGTWAGVYTCPQGPTALALDMRGDRDGAVKATFRFEPVAENPGVPSGAYRMVGAHDADGRLVLLGERWERRPADYVMVDLDGWFDARADVIRGTVCGTAVVLSRQSNR